MVTIVRFDYKNFRTYKLKNKTQIQLDSFGINGSIHLFSSTHKRPSLHNVETDQRLDKAVTKVSKPAV